MPDGMRKREQTGRMKGNCYLGPQCPKEESGRWCSFFSKELPLGIRPNPPATRNAFPDPVGKDVMAPANPLLADPETIPGGEPVPGKGSPGASGSTRSSSSEVQARCPESFGLCRDEALACLTSSGPWPWRAHRRRRPARLPFPSPSPQPRRPPSSPSPRSCSANP